MTDLRPHLLIPAVLAIGILAYAFHGAAEDAKLKIVVESGAFQFEPAFVRLRVRIEPDAANRGLLIAALSDAYETSSYEQLEGEDARISRWIEWKDVPAGVYTVQAVVARPSDKPWRASAGFTVLGR